MMKNSSIYYKEAPGSKRLYYFDWLRTIAFMFVLLIHCVEMFHDLYQGRNAPALMNDALTDFLPAFAQWCMALYFLLAGASTWFALERKSVTDFVRERFTRLLMPLVFGLVLLLPLQAYVVMISNNSYHGSLIAFYPFFAGEVFLNGHFDLIVQNIHHLWFLEYLFGISLLTLPLCLYLRSSGGRWCMAYLQRCPGGLLVLALPLLGVQLTLLPIFPVYCGIANVACWLLVYMYGYVLFSNPMIQEVLRQQGRRALMVGALFSVILFGIWCAGLLRGNQLIPCYTLIYMLYQVIATMALWSLLIATLALAGRYMNWSSPLLKYSSSASFYWYLLHFPIVAICACYILTLTLPAWLAFCLIGISSFVVTWLLTDLLPLQRRALKQIYSIFVSPVRQPLPEVRFHHTGSL